MRTLIDTEATISQVRDVLIDKNKVIEDMKQLVVAKNHKILDFTDVDMDGFTEYLEGMKIRNITSALQHILGVTLLQVQVSKEIDFEWHEHEGQSQTIYVMQGKLLDLENNILFKANESYFVSKAHSHKIKYYAGAEALIVYLPSLNIVRV